MEPSQPGPQPAPRPGTAGRTRGPGTGDDVVRAMRDVDRRMFLPRNRLRWAHEDRPLEIGHGQTCSQPSTVAAMLRLLQVPTGASVLDVGAGSGWTTALLARLVGPQGEVLGVERLPDLAAWGAANVRRTRMPWARVVRSLPDVLGVPRPGGWERVLVSAAAETMPDALVDLLAPGGRLVLPVRHEMVLVERDADGELQVSGHGTYSFVPLVED